MDTASNGTPDNPVVVRVRRAGEVESVHRGAWCLVDGAGTVLDGAGRWDHPVWVRSSIKSIQALPLVETGAADRFGFSGAELALALASHSGEPCHTETVCATLARLGLSVDDLRCGAHPPNDSGARFALRSGGGRPNALHNNCSGKHAGFLALALHLGVATDRYLDPDSEGQRLARSALAELTDTPVEALAPGVDGCSAPTYRVPLRGLATAFARITTPNRLEAKRAACFERLTAAARANPVLVGGSRERIDTDLLRATGGRLFPKIGAEAVHAIGVCERDRGLAVKVDDGGARGLHALVIGLLERLGLLESDAERGALAHWRDPVLRNHAGLEVGRVEAVLA